MTMQFEKGQYNELKRASRKASYDKETIYAILDACEVCHIAFIYEGKAFVQPINFGRYEDKIYVHGALKNRMTSALIEAGEACVNVMILDAMKLTRSAFHHSVNYRSVMVFGQARELLEDEEKLLGLKAIINHFVPDRWEHCRPPNEKELKATRVIEIGIDSASAKIAEGPPSDNNFDLDLPYWAGTIPVRQNYGAPEADAHVKEGQEVPVHIVQFQKGKNN